MIFNYKNIVHKYYIVSTVFNLWSEICLLGHITLPFNYAGPLYDTIWYLLSTYMQGTFNVFLVLFSFILTNELGTLITISIL